MLLQKLLPGNHWYCLRLRKKYNNNNNNKKIKNVYYVCYIVCVSVYVCLIISVHNLLLYDIKFGNLITTGIVKDLYLWLLL